MVQRHLVNVSVYQMSSISTYAFLIHAYQR